MKKQFIIASLAIIALGAIATVIASKRSVTAEETDTKRQPLAVTTERVADQHSATWNFSVAGTVASESEATLSANVTGTIVSSMSDLGKSVSAGQLLFRIDTPESSVDAASGFQNSDIRTAALTLANAKKAYDQARYDDEHSKTYLSRLARQQAKNSQEIAQTAYQAALDRYLVKSPIAGTLTVKNVSIGDTVSAGDTLAVISRGKKLIRFYVDDAERSLLSTKQTISFSKETDMSDAIDGTIVRISPVADAASRQFLVEAESSDTRFAGTAPGSIVTVSISVSKQAAPGRFFLPLSALSQDQDGNAIFIYADGQAKRVAVKLESIEGETVELSGLSDDMSVITTRTKLLKDGDSVTLD